MMSEKDASAVLGGSAHSASDVGRDLPATNSEATVHQFAPGDRVRVSEDVKTRYFPQSEQAGRAGWTGTVNTLCSRPFEDHVYVDFDLRPRQRRQRLKEFMDVRDLERAPEIPSAK
jgi:hypothetical protein